MDTHVGRQTHIIINIIVMITVPAIFPRPFQPWDEDEDEEEHHHHENG